MTVTRLSETATIAPFGIGDVVAIKSAFQRTAAQRTDTYTVVKINPRTLGLRNTRTNGKLNADPEVLELAADRGVAPVAAPTAVRTYEEMLAEIIPTGTVVAFKRAPRGHTTTDLFVVTGETARGYRLFRLGGSSRYFTSIPASDLIVQTIVSIGTTPVTGSAS